MSVSKVDYKSGFMKARSCLTDTAQNPSELYQEIKFSKDGSWVCNDVFIYSDLITWSIWSSSS